MPIPELPALPTDITSDSIARTASTSDVDPIVAYLNGAHANINQLVGALEADFGFATDPGLAEYVLNQPTGVESLVPTVPFGKYRLTAPATVTDVNYRTVRASGKAGVMGDSLVRSTWFSQSTAMSDSHARFQPGHSHRVKADKQRDYIGQASAGGGSTITGTGTPFTVNQWAGSAGFQIQYYVTVIAGSGLGQTRRIVSNTTSVLTVDSAWGSAVGGTSAFEIWHYNVRAVTLSQNIAFNAHALLNVHCWDGPSFQAVGQIDLGSYLKPGGTYVQFPWYVKSRVRGLTLDVVVGKGSDTDPAFGAAGQGASFTLPAGWDQAGMSGLYLGHLQANDFLEFDDLQIVRL